MDPEWRGPGKYRPADGSSWREATGSTEWIPCEKDDDFGRWFIIYDTFKEHKQKLRLKDRLNAY